jgi:hypothetical protein
LNNREGENIEDMDDDDEDWEDAEIGKYHR